MVADGRPVDPQTRERVVGLIRAGELGRNAIAREVRLSGSTVSRIAQDEGLTFDRSVSELALRARQIDLGKMRVELANAAMVKAWDALEQMDAPATLTQFEAGHQLTTHEGETEIATWVPGEWREHVIDAPTFSDQRNLATVFGIMVTKVRELTTANEAAGSAGAVSLVSGLMSDLSVVRDALIANAPNAPEVDSDPTVEPTNVSRESMIADYEAVAEGESEDIDRP